MFQDINTCTIALQLVFAELLKSDIDFLKVRNRLMKEVLVPLRLCTEDYNERFMVHADIAARRLKKWEFLLLHEIAASLRDGSGGKVVVSQREELVNYNSVKNPEGKIVNNTDYPELCKIDGRNFQSNFELMRQLKYSRNVNIQMVFDQLLGFSATENISQEKMPRRILSMVTLDFNRHLLTTIGACGGVKRERKGCTELPGIVFWNLRGDLSFPARHTNRVTMVNGYSNDSLSALLERDVVPLLEHLRTLKKTDKLKIINKYESFIIFPSKLVLVRYGFEVLDDPADHFMFLSTTVKKMFPGLWTADCNKRFNVYLVECQPRMISNARFVATKMNLSPTCTFI
ncbi:hypothetical protein DKX38_014237 [Salix brachista]|uniref:DUF7788 domain-containing protein n=1 Tax=Salix brachista TaxID=2182728 RepID=A0A5N5LEQ3_9ROSI|nr:hypothetical protein DKX38_014237 [Salix brachista]